MAVPVGAWSLPAVGRNVAFYVLSGSLARRVQVAGRPSIELIGPGQLLRPEPDFALETVAHKVCWKALAPTWLALLDSGFWSAVAPFPSVVVALLDRGLGRAHSLSARLAMNGSPNLAARIHLLLWHLADSHGRVTPEGTLVDLRLSHETIADLVSASRPSVSAALKKLERGGEVVRSTPGGYLLCGPAPAISTSRPRDKAVNASTLIEVATNVLGAGVPT